MRRLITRFPLRITLVVLLVVLTGFGLAVAGFATTVSLQNFLTTRLDRQLVESAERLAERGPREFDQRTFQDRDDAGPRRYFIRYVSADGQTSIDVPGFSSEATSIIPIWSLAEAPNRPETIGFLRDSWRVTTHPLRDGSGYVVVAESMDNINAILTRLVLLESIIGAGILIAIGMIGYLAVRWALRPLGDVERTAHGIAAGVSEGAFGERVPESDSRSEVGSLAMSFNTMVDRIESAFAERELSESQARASEERMRRFIADASHELRTPLTTIRGFAELQAQQDVDPADRTRAMLRIEEASLRMGVLIEDLLLLARLDQQRPLQQKPVDLLEIWSAAVAGMRAAYPDRVISMQVSITQPPVVAGDELRLRQIADNLVSNALRHTPGDVRVSLATEPGFAVASVSDDGPGLSPENLENVFERFFRADESRTRSTGGTGLGLAIVRSLTTAHGGSVDVVSTPETGSTFTVRLPLTGDAQEDPSAAQDSSSTVES